MVHNRLAPHFTELLSDLAMLSLEQRFALRCYLERITREQASNSPEHIHILTATLLAALICCFEERTRCCKERRALLVAKQELLVQELEQSEDRMAQLLKRAASVEKSLRYQYAHRPLPNSAAELPLVVMISITMITVLATYAGFTAKHHTASCTQAEILPLTLLAASQHAGKVQAERFFMRPILPVECR